MITSGRWEILVLVDLAQKYFMITEINLKEGSPGSSDQDGDRFIEIWNLVFMQYEQISREKE